MVSSPFAASLEDLEFAIRKGIASEPDPARLDYQQARAALRQLIERAGRAEAGLVALRPYASHDEGCAFARDLALLGPAAARGGEAGETDSAGNCRAPSDWRRA